MKNKRLLVMLAVTAIVTSTMVSGTTETYGEEISTDSSEEILTGNAQASAGIYIANLDANGLLAGMATESFTSDAGVEYRWLYYDETNGTWNVAQDWTANNEWINWKPAKYGNYVIQSEVRDIADNSRCLTASTGIGYHPNIKGKCQMPYGGEGGGYLIGVESYDNPNQEYQYEMLILDCTLLAQGKDAWTYTTGKCSVPETSFWTVWQPQYGYYWTLFRVYDKNGNIIDEDCYGFENTGAQAASADTPQPSVPETPAQPDTPVQPVTPDTPSDHVHNWQEHEVEVVLETKPAWDEVHYDVVYELPDYVLVKLQVGSMGQLLPEQKYMEAYRNAYEIAANKSEKAHDDPINFTKEDEAEQEEAVNTLKQLFEEGHALDVEEYAKNMSDEEKAAVNAFIDKWYPQYKDSDMLEKCMTYLIYGDAWYQDASGTFEKPGEIIHHEEEPIKTIKYTDYYYCTECDEISKVRMDFLSDEQINKINQLVDQQFPKYSNADMVLKYHLWGAYYGDYWDL